MVKCPECKTKNPKNSKFCQACGNLLDEPKEVTKLKKGKHKVLNGKISVYSEGLLYEPKHSNNVTKLPWDQIRYVKYRSMLNRITITMSNLTEHTFVGVADSLSGKSKVLKGIYLITKQKLEERGVDLESEGRKIKEEKQKRKEQNKQAAVEARKNRIVSSINGYDYDNSTNITLILREEGIELKRKGVWTGRDRGFEEISYSDITSIGIKKGLVMSTVEIKYPGGKLKIGNVIKDEGDLFIQGVKQKMQNTTKTTTQNLEASNPMDEIKKAKELLDIGAITQEQFEEIRDKYIKRI